MPACSARTRATRRTTGLSDRRPRPLRFLPRPPGPRRRQRSGHPPGRLGALSQFRQRHLRQRDPVPSPAVLPLHRHAQRRYRDHRGRRRRRLGRPGVRLGPGPVLAPERVREYLPVAQERRGRRRQSLGRLYRRQLLPDRRAPELRSRGGRVQSRQGGAAPPGRRPRRLGGRCAR
jgi:hypothetical protein